MGTTHHTFESESDFDINWGNNFNLFVYLEHEQQPNHSICFEEILLIIIICMSKFLSFQSVMNSTEYFSLSIASQFFF